MPGKFSNEAQEDILSQLTVDDEDANDFGDNQPNDDDEQDDKVSTDPVADDDDENEDDDIDTRQPKEQDEDDEIINSKKRLKEDKKGNLVDRKGNIVAAAGKERGIFTKMRERLAAEQQASQAMAKQLNDIAAGTRELMTKYKALQEQRAYGDTLGLTSAEQQEAQQFFAQSKIDPQGAIRKILTKFHLAGNDLSSIGVSGPLDPAEVARHLLELQEAKKPKPTEPVKQDDPPEVKEVEAFMGRYPELAKVDPKILTAIGDAKDKFPQMSLDEIWIKIRDHLKAQKEQTTQKPQQRQQTPARPIPNNGTTPRVSSKKGLDTSGRNPNQSFSDIGRELLADLKSLED
jgi:hypothetical protein